MSLEFHSRFPQFQNLPWSPMFLGLCVTVFMSNYKKNGFLIVENIDLIAQNLTMVKIKGNCWINN